MHVIMMTLINMMTRNIFIKWPITVLTAKARMFPCLTQHPTAHSDVSDDDDDKDGSAIIRFDDVSDTYDKLMHNNKMY